MPTLQKRLRPVPKPGTKSCAPAAASGEKSGDDGVATTGEAMVETKVYCFRLLGERVRSRDYDREVAELQIRAAILNRVNAFGTPQTQRVA